VKQNWLGFSVSGNSGTGLGTDFARAIHQNLNTIFRSFGEETITRGAHLEKICLIKDGVGRDNLSDFTTNLIKRYLLGYTEQFAVDHIASDQRASWQVDKVRFNYDTRSWERGEFMLPTFGGDFALLTPKDILTRDETWINRPGLINSFYHIAAAVPDSALRAQINDYFKRQLSRKPKEKEIRQAASRTIAQYPVLIEHYIKQQEDNGDDAVAVSKEEVGAIEQVFIAGAGHLITELREVGFYDLAADTLEEARRRALYLKDIIENKDGYKALYFPNGDPIRRESHLQVMYRLVWVGTASDVNREVNNGRGPADFTVSRGAADKTVVELKLASNSKLEQNLAKQAEIYQKAADAQYKLKVILYFDDAELERVQNILKRLKLTDDSNIILIDAQKKISASNA
jgi:hypothetical protein